MSKTGNKDEFKVPTYEIPTADNYSLYGRTATKDANGYSVSLSPEDQQTMNTVKQLRSDLLSSLGINSGGADDPYTKALMSESLRLSQPKLENSLIGRGLGGSSVYSNSLTDLLSKAGIQAILGGQQYKTNNLNALQNYLTNENSLGQNLLQLQQSGLNQKANLYDKQYQQLLAQAMSDYEHEGQMSENDLLASKIMSIVDPGGSYLGFWNNPTKTGQNAQSMSGLGKAMGLVSGLMSMIGTMKGSGGGGSGFTDTSQTQNPGLNTDAAGSVVGQDYSWLQSLMNQEQNNGYLSNNYSALLGKNAY